MPTVAIVGASSDRKKFGNKSVRAHRRAGWQVFPVNPFVQEIEQLQTYPTVSDVPVRPLDRISIYLPPSILAPILSDIANVGAKEVWLNPGADSPEIMALAKGLGLHVIRSCSIVDVGFNPSDFPQD